MGVITIDSRRVLGMLDELSRCRALSDVETDLLEEIITLGETPFRWSRRLDMGLVHAASTPGGIARFARRHSITPMAAYCRLHRLRKSAKGERLRRGKARG